jgi:hypothetical protein
MEGTERRRSDKYKEILNEWYHGSNYVLASRAVWDLRA